MEIEEEKQDEEDHELDKEKEMDESDKEEGEVVVRDIQHVPSTGIKKLGREEDIHVSLPRSSKSSHKFLKDSAAQSKKECIPNASSTRAPRKKST